MCVFSDGIYKSMVFGDDIYDVYWSIDVLLRDMCNSWLLMKWNVVLCTGEAKNLLARSHGSVGVRDVYCVLSLDQEEIFRSATIEKTLEWVMNTFVTYIICLPYNISLDYQL